MNWLVHKNPNTTISVQVSNTNNTSSLACLFLSSVSGIAVAIDADAVAALILTIILPYCYWCCCCCPAGWHCIHTTIPDRGEGRKRVKFVSHLDSCVSSRRVVCRSKFKKSALNHQVQSCTLARDFKPIITLSLGHLFFLNTIAPLLQSFFIAKLIKFTASIDFLFRGTHNKIFLLVLFFLDAFLLCANYTMNFLHYCSFCHDDLSFFFKYKPNFLFLYQICTQY